MRKYLRQIAKARMKACGVGNVNKKMARTNSKGEKLWMAFMWCEFAADGIRAQLGLKRKRSALRKIRRISPATR